MEIWKAVVGYEGYYEVSTFGRVRSVDRTVANGRRYKGVILSQYKNKFGYYEVYLRRNCEKKMHRVNRAVAIAFIENTSNYPDVGHDDDNKENNHVSNLYWTTPSENNTHNNLASRRGVKTRKPVIAKKDKEIIKYDSFTSAERAGFIRSNIHACLNGTQKTHRGYTWSRYVENV